MAGLSGILVRGLSGDAVVVALLLALVCAVVLLPARRGAAGGAHGGRDRRLGFRERPERKEPPDVGLVLTEVATLLRAGAAPQRAWQRSLARAGLVDDGPEVLLDGRDAGVPRALVALGQWVEPSWLPRRAEGRWHWRPPLPGRSAATGRRRAGAAAVPGAVAACRLTAVLGAPLAAVLESVADGVAESGRAESSRTTALSGPRATARLLALLPLVGLGLGAAVGAGPQEVLLDGSWGSALGCLGVVLMAVGHRMTNGFVSAAQAPAGRVDEALVLDLACAALEAGASLPGALAALGRALEEEQLVVVARALLLGSAWDRAWRAPEDPRWRRERSRLEGCLRPGWEDGASPGPLLAATAASLRAGRQARDREAAERLAVRLVLPLGLCHLPAFIILGIVPVVVGAGADLLHG